MTMKGWFLVLPYHDGTVLARKAKFVCGLQAGCYVGFVLIGGLAFNLFTTMRYVTVNVLTAGT